MESIDVVVGRIGKPHGLRGEVTIDVRTDEPDRRFAIGSVLRAEPPKGSSSKVRSLTVRSSRWHQGILLLGFVGVEAREGAEAIRGIVLHADIPADFRPEDPDEFYEHQLIGLVVHDLEGSQIGVVTGLVPGAAQDLLQVKASDGRDALVPFVSELVPEVDLGAGRVVVADRPGLVSPFLDEE